MGHHYFATKDKSITGHIHVDDIFHYKGFTFSWHDYMGPQLLTKKLEPAKRIKRGFWDVLDEFLKLLPEQKEEYQIYG